MLSLIYSGTARYRYPGNSQCLTKKMFRNIIKSLEPLRNRMYRAATGEAGGTSFEKNSVTREQQLSEALKRCLPGITYITIEDISGGCGAMFEISVEAKEFIGLSRVKQHRLVTDSLKSEIAEMHGVRIHTSPTQVDK